MAKPKKAGRPEAENLLAGLTNIETGELPPGNTGTYFPSMKAAAHALKIDIAILQEARSKDCPAFRTGSLVHRRQLIDYLAEQNKKNPQPQNPLDEQPPEGEEEFEEDYSIPDEIGGVGQTLKSLQAYERRAKRKLDDLEKNTKLHPATKTEMVKRAQDAWLKVVNSLLKYDLAVDMAKRESGELLPLEDAVKGVRALLAWHTVATSDALRNVIPECEGRSKYEIATLLDPALRSAIYRNFRMGVKLGKIPEWMGKSATDFVREQSHLSLDVPPESKPISSNPEDY